MSYVRLAHEGHELEITTESIDVTPMTEADPNWTFTDSAGHPHRYDKDAPDGPYPTLEYRPRHGCGGSLEPGADPFEEPGCDYDGDQELCHPVLSCKQCGAWITPGSRIGMPHRIPGLRTYLIDGKPVSKQAADDFVAAARGEAQAAAQHVDRPPLAPEHLEAVRAAIRAAGLRLWLKSMFGPSAARRMIRDAWVSLDRDDTET